MHFFPSLVLVLTMLPAIAFASPPDPAWIVGIYDGADGDDIVSLIYETTAANVLGPPLPRFSCSPTTSLESSVHWIPEGRVTGRPRSPPVALASSSPALVLNNRECRSVARGSHEQRQE